MNIIVRRRGRRQDATVRANQYRFVHAVRGARISERLLRMWLYLIGGHAFSPTEVQDLTACKGAQPINVLGTRLILQQRASFFPALECFRGIRFANPSGCALEMSDRLERLTGRLIMESEQPGEFVELSPIEAFDRLGDSRVQRDQSGPQLHRVSHLLDERMTKRKKSLVIGRQIVKQLGLPEMRNRFGQLFMRQSRDGF